MWLRLNAGVVAARFSPNDCLKLLNQWRHFVLNRVPHSVQIDSVVALNYPVAHADNLRPRDVGVALLSSWRDPSGCLANDSHQPFQCELQYSILRQFNCARVA